MVNAGPTPNASAPPTVEVVGKVLNFLSVTNLVNLFDLCVHPLPANLRIQKFAQLGVLYLNHEFTLSVPS